MEGGAFSASSASSIQVASFQGQFALAAAPGISGSYGRIEKTNVFNVRPKPQPIFQSAVEGEYTLEDLPGSVQMSPVQMRNIFGSNGKRTGLLLPLSFQVPEENSSCHFPSIQLQ